MYGVQGRLHGCLRQTGRRTGTLAITFEDIETSGRWSDVKVAGVFAWWTYTSVDQSCKAACPPGYQSTTKHVSIYDVKRRHMRRVEKWDELVVTSRGVAAWTTHTADGTVTLSASLPSGKQRRLDTGSIAPGSLKANGPTITWVKGGTSHSVRLG
jgi:hypothetical protein